MWWLIAETSKSPAYLQPALPLPSSTVPVLVIRPAPAHPFLPVPVDEPEGCGVFRKGSLAADDHGDILSIQQVLNSDFSWRRYPGDDLAENILKLVSMLALSNPDTPTASWLAF